MFERLHALLFVAICAAGLLAGGCDDKEPEEDQTDSAVQSLETRAWKPPEPIDLRQPDSFEQKTLELTDARKFPDCHRLFEPGGQPAAAFPLSDAQLRPLELAGCEPEAYRVMEDDSRYVAYAVASDGPGWDMRLVAYDADGNLRWHDRLDRSENAKNFKANFRGSFITPLLPRLVCAGSLWEGGTEAVCLKAETGERAWEGMMKFWAGVAPRGLGNGLTTASLTGLTRRYPYSGVEMRYKPFEAKGGRAAYYAADQRRLFYVPAKGDSLQMHAYDLESFEELWRIALPERPAATWEHAFEEAGVALFLADKTVWAVDADSGEVLWGATVGENAPSVAADEDGLYLLHHRAADPNLLYSIAPKTGQVHWVAQTPAGTLEVLTYEDALVLKSVRAVQKVVGVE